MTITRFSPMGDGTVEYFEDGDWCAWDEVEEEITLLRQRVAELEADAERWSYAIRDPLTFCRALNKGYPGETPSEAINAAIDAAMEN